MGVFTIFDMPDKSRNQVAKVKFESLMKQKSRVNKPGFTYMYVMH
jgi:hypothetical protein